MFHIVIDHPPIEEEFEVVRSTTSLRDIAVRTPGQRRRPGRVPAPGAARARRGAGDALRARPGAREPAEVADRARSVKKWAAFGASVRAAQHLVLGGKARALTNGRYHVNFEDIRALAHPVLRHRVLTNFHAQSEGITSDALVDKLLEAVPMPRSGM